MLCGSPAMLADLTQLLRERGFDEGSHSEPAHFVVEKAFVEK
jgi:ferredoxin--NADP+ reductase